MDTILSVSPRDRMLAALDALGYGLMPPLRCENCQPRLCQRCDACARRREAVARVTAAIDAVEDAPTDAEAAAAYRECWAEVGGLGTVSAPRD
jgi:hypothetical protein